MLTFDEKRRYARHLLMPIIGEAGQEKLTHARVLVIGAGGLGAASLSYLAATGIGTLGIMDHDHVELSNLGRQIIHETADIGRRKTESAADRISEINPATKVETITRRFTGSDEDALLLASFDLVLDGSDNFETRFALNRLCHHARKPWISAAVRGWHAQIASFTSYLGAPHPCYQCFVPALPADRNDCAENGVVSPLVGIAGSLQALEAIKELLGVGNTLSGRLLRYDALTAEWKHSRLQRDPHCPMCGA